jgi:hypothetical protein
VSSYAWAVVGTKGLEVEGASTQANGETRTRYCYVSCQDYLCQEIDVPKLSAKDRVGFIRMRLARYFPDPSAENPVSLIQSPGSKRVLAIFTSPSSLKSYRDRFPEAALICIHNLGPLPGSGGARIVIGPSWIETIASIDGAWSKAERIGLDDPTGTAAGQGEGEATTIDAAVMALIASGGPGAAPTSVDIVFESDRRDVALALREALSARGLKRIALRPFGDALKRLSPLAPRIFPPSAEKPSSSRKAFAPIALGLVAILSLNAFIERLNLAAAKDSERLIGELRAAQAATKEEKALKAEIALLEKRIASTSFSGLSPYPALEALAAAVGDGGKLREFTLENGRCTIVIDAKDAMGCISRLEKSGVFTDLEISPIQPQGALERFTLRGRLREAP